MAVVTLVLVIGGGDGSYEVRARFLDAGQLVKGNLVEVAGQRVGKVKDIRVTDDGRAEVVLRITSERYRPLHRGTRLTIRTVGLAGVANRYIEVQPGSRQAPAIADGGVLQTDATTGIVDLDQLLDAFGPPARRDLRAIIVASAHGVRGNARATNRLLRYLSQQSARPARCWRTSPRTTRPSAA
ncbi:MlaD family protein [Conexibacter sp. W3-3-2]|uniref:MlaD family protein n=1 Tax=Conexibacter sp. W3-3-2 TaxID=2675227 RepID=UPI0018A9C275|nr:MlaD family protein [Conexibacter sp. W3-3-2]